MKILLVHNFYQQPGGEDKVFNSEVNLLRSMGHQVSEYTVHNNSLNFFKKIKLTWQTHYSNSSERKFSRFLEYMKPDLVHIHNFFPILSPSILKSCFNKSIPSILTLHNYRLIYPNGLLFHNGKIDENSLKGSAYSCIKNKVYRNSYLQTAVVAHMIEYHKKKNTWNNYVDKFIALTNFSKKKFIEGGLPADKIAVKANFIYDHYEKIKKEETIVDRKNYYLYVGRISIEKGIKQLIESFLKKQNRYNLKVIGDGPLKHELEKASLHTSNIEWLGVLDSSAVLKYMLNARALVFPSLCYENFPITILEAFSMGLPVLVTNIGSSAEIIKNNITGIHFNPHDPDSLNDKIDSLEKNDELLQAMKINARREYLEKYTPAKNYEKLMQIYKNVREEKGLKT